MIIPIISNMTDKDKEARRDYYRKWREKNHDAKSASEKEWREKNREKLQSYHKDYRAKNSDKLRAYRKEYRANSEYKIRTKETRADYMRKWREKNRDRLLIYYTTPEFKTLRKANSIRNRTKILAQQQRYMEKNRDKMAARTRQWRLENPEKAAECNRKWRAKNPEQYSHNHRVRTVRRRQRKVVGSHTAADIRDILKLQRNRCAICREKLGKKYHVDHIVPLSKGGSNDRTNIQITCGPCNLVKGARDPIDHMRSLGKLL